MDFLCFAGSADGFFYAELDRYERKRAFYIFPVYRTQLDSPGSATSLEESFGLAG